MTTTVDQERLFSTTDAAVWAEEFAKVAPGVDKGFMIGWFANAIETAKDFGRRDALRCSPWRPCDSLDESHIDLYGECFVKSFERMVKLPPPVETGTLIRVAK